MAVVGCNLLIGRTESVAGCALMQDQSIPGPGTEPVAVDLGGLDAGVCLLELRTDADVVTLVVVRE